MMVNTRHAGPAPVVTVPFDLPDDHAGDVEVTTLARMRERAGPGGFSTVQRLDFDLVVRVDSGAATHSVDFSHHGLAPGDVLWIRAGQIHRWGRIADIDGPVVLFTPLVVDDRTRDLVRAAGTRPQNHWSAATLHGVGLDQTWSLLAEVGTGPGALPLEQNLRAHVVRSLVTQLALVQAQGAVTASGPSTTRDAFLAFRDEIDRRFTTDRHVADYAARLGYSTRTLGRLARTHAGVTAKHMIDERVLLEAKRLLSHGDDPVARIATALGFDDASNFSAFFTTRAGATPSAFRRGDHDVPRTQ